MRNTAIRRVLVVSRFYPPMMSARSIQAERAVEALRLQGIDVRVIADSGVHLGESKAPAVEPQSGPKWRSKLNRSVAEIGLYFRLPRLSWPSAMSLLRQALKNNWRPDCILSMSVPSDSHMTGNRFAKYLRIPHALFLSDPFPIWIAPGPYSRAPNFLYSGLQLSVIKSLLGQADALLVPTKEMATLLRSTFSEIQDIPIVETLHCALPAFVPDEVETVPSIYHVGQLTAARCSPPFFSALRALAEKTNHSRDTIVFLGDVDASFRSAVADLEQSGFIRFDAPVSADRSREIMRRAKALLLIEADMEAGPFLPSKITDYAAAKRPIIIVSNPGSALDRLVANRTGVFTIPHDEDQILSALIKVIDADFDQQSDLQALFEPRFVGARYLEGLKAACEQYFQKVG